VEDSVPDRYDHNPMLILVENFILDAIGKLEPGKAARLNEIVTRTFGGTDWRATLRHHLALPADTAATLQTLWQQAQAEAELKQEDFTAEDFARHTADDLFRDMGN
jgi:hypothetical protein